MWRHRQSQPSYDSGFFKSIGDGSYRSARVVVPLLIDLLGPMESVVDVGCGTGAWLKVFCESGVTDVLGIDGAYVDPSQLEVPEDRFRVADLNSFVPPRGRYNLALCLEVAEHLPESSADSLIDALVALSDLVLFSAAIPLQGGRGHVNEQWPGYWAKRFAQRGYLPLDVLRHRIWDEPDVAPWFAQNTILYANRAALDRWPGLAAEAADGQTAILALVHPGCYLPKARTAARFLQFYDRPSVAALRAVTRRVR